MSDGRRVTIDLTPAAVAELDLVKNITGITTADIFRHAFTLLRIYVDERQKGNFLMSFDPNEDERTRIELPIEFRGRG